MAMISCVECGQAVSDRATACPKCGCPLGGKKQPAPPLSSSSHPSTEGWEVVGKTTFSRKGVLLQVGGLFILWFMGAIFNLLGVMLGILVMLLTYIREPLMSKSWHCGACGKELVDSGQEQCPHCRQPLIKASWF